MNAPRDAAAHRRMHMVIVLRRQIKVEERAVLVACGVGFVAEAASQRVRLTFDLFQTPAGDRSEIAECSVDRADEVTLDRAQPFAEIASEEVTDGWIVMQLAPGGIDVDLIGVGKP